MTTTGDGSEYPDIELRVGGFLERLKTTGHDPSLEKGMGDAHIKSLREDQRRERNQTSIDPVKYKTIPLEGIDQWTMEQVQSGLL